MSCCISNYDWCFIKQESFKSPFFEFKDLNISNDTFEYIVTSFNPKKKQSFPVLKKDENTIYLNEFNLKIGNYEHELIWDRNGVKEVVFQGKLTITDKSNSCNCNEDITQEITVDTGDQIINISITESIVNNFIWSGSVLAFEVNENMELIMYETVPTPLDFIINDGFLILNF